MWWNNKKKIKNKRELICIAAGGTGGHVFPAKALIAILVRRYNILFFTDQRGKSFIGRQFSTNNKSEIKQTLVVLPIRSIGSGIITKLTAIITVLISTAYSFFWLCFHRPRLVIGFGGYPSFPVLGAAVPLRITIALHEQNALLGKTNSMFLPIAKKLFVSFPNTYKIAKRFISKVVYTGNPIRKDFTRVSRESSSIHIKGIETSDLRILVIGGSHGTELFCHIVPQAIALLPEYMQQSMQIAHQARIHLLSDTSKIYQKLKIKKFLIKPFFRNIAQLMAKADLVIARAGASTIAELIYMQKPAILVPLLSAMSDHQTYNARYLIDKGAALLLCEKELNTTKLCDILKHLLNDDAAVLREMQRKADKLEKTRAAELLAVRVNNLLMHRKPHCIVKAYKKETR